MRSLVLIILVAGIVGGMAVGQPKDGDLVVYASDTNGYHLLYLDPSQPGVSTTLVSGIGFGVRMAPDNSNLVTVGNNSAFLDVTPGGKTTTLAMLPQWLGIRGWELDHDGQWILSATYASMGDVYLLGIDHQSRTVNTLAWFDHDGLSDLAIDREPGSMPYVAIGRDDLHNPPYNAWELIWGNRKGAEKTITRLGLTGGSVELHPHSGEFLVGMSTINNASWLVRVDRSGGISTLASFSGYGVRVTQDDLAWVTGSYGTLLEYDLSQNTVVTLVPVPKPWTYSSIEVYGSRRIVCNQPSTSPNLVKVNVASRKLGDGGKFYALACSLARRPASPAQCLQFPNGEYLFLDYTDNLFWTSFMGWAPSVFQRFKGVLDSKGNASAQVNIPSSLPPNLGITIFVAGVIYDNTGVLTVTNTHWFVLS